MINPFEQELKSSESEAEKYVGRINESEQRLVAGREKPRDQEELKVTFEALSRSNLAEARGLVETVFANKRDKAGEDIQAIVDKLDSKESADQAHAEWGQKYWLARNESGEAVGITGFSQIMGDRPEHCWLGWFATRPDLRGLNLGETLLRQATEQAGASGKSEMYIISSDRPDMYGNAKFYAAQECPVVGVINKSGIHVTEKIDLSREVVDNLRKGYAGGVDVGLNIYIRRHSIKEIITRGAAETAAITQSRSDVIDPGKLVDQELAEQERLRDQGVKPSPLSAAPNDEPKGFRTVEVKTRQAYRETIAALKEIFTDPTDLETDRSFATMFFSPKLARYFRIEDGQHNVIGVQMVRINQDHVPDAMYTPYGGVKSDYRSLNIYPQAAKLNADQMRQFGVKFGMNDCEDPKRIQGVYPDEDLDKVIDRCNRRLNYFKRSLGMYFVDDDAVPYCRPASDNTKNIQAYDLLGFRALDINDPMWKNVFNEEKTAITKEAYGDFYLKLMQLEYGDAKVVPTKETLRAEYPAIDQFFRQMDALPAEKKWITLHAGEVREKTTANLTGSVVFRDANERDERKSKGALK